MDIPASMAAPWAIGRWFSRFPFRMSQPSAAVSSKPGSSLFRTQVLENVSNRAHGTVILARPLSYSILTAIFGAIAVAICLFLALASYTRKVDVQGILTPSQGLVRLVAPQGGLVVESKVREGQAVAAGEVLFVISGERQTAGEGSAERAISALLQARRDSLRHDEAEIRLQDAQRLDAARRRAQDIAADIRRIDDQAEIQSRRVEMARTTVKRYTDLAAANFVSSVQVQDKQAELLDQQQRLVELQRAAAASARDLEAAHAQVRDLEVQAVRNQQSAQRDISATEQTLTENEARRQLVVRAPNAGTVTAITAEPGQTIAATQALAAILPADLKLEADLYAPSRAAGFLKPGMDVQLRYQAYAYQKFGQAKGRILEISRTAMQPDELRLVGISSNQPVFRVRVALDRQSMPAYGKDQPLRSGAALDGSIVLDTRRLYEWVLEPLYTITGHLQ